MRDNAGNKVMRTFPTETLALDFRDRAKVAIRDGKMRATTSPLSVHEAGETMLARMENGQLTKRGGSAYKPSTIRLYRQVLEDHVYPPLGAAQLAKVRRADIQRLHDELPAGLDGSTARNVLAPLRVMFREGIKSGVIDTSPIHDLDLRDKRNLRPAVLEGEQVQRLLDTAKTDDRALFGVILLAGLRLGEVLALRWRNIDLARAEIHVDDAYDPKAHEFVGPKTRKSIRSVPIMGSLRDLLVAHRANCPWADDPAGLVFGSTAGTPRVGSTSWRRLKRACEDAGVPVVHHHGGRHTAASVFIRAGVALEDTADFLGHSSVVTTGDIYRHALDEAKADFRRTMDGYYTSANSGARLAQLEDGAEQ
jgi:integrase